MRRFITAGLIASLMMLMVPAHAATQNVVGAGFSFVPAVVVASGSDTITLSSVGTFPHTFSTAASICASPTRGTAPCSTGAISGGLSGSVQLQATPGTYDFFCEFHRSFGMVGKLIVK